MIDREKKRTNVRSMWYEAGVGTEPTPRTGVVASPREEAHSRPTGSRAHDRGPGGVRS